MSIVDHSIPSRTYPFNRFRSAFPVIRFYFEITQQWIKPCIYVHLILSIFGKAGIYTGSKWLKSISINSLC
jgi:hypothetical protein